AQPSERSARRIAQPIPSVLASDATPRCASMASADRQMIGDATVRWTGAVDRSGSGPGWPRARPTMRRTFHSRPPAAHPLHAALRTIS
ncbi:hypothetical protein D8B29_08090, partial [Verminephrobacter eiseniae]|nr:hypothetical protein [Verminephrobacter eiseniae]